MSERRQAPHVFPFFPILALIFIVLKLTGYVGWSWWWVLAPMWIPAVLALAFILVGIVVGVSKR